MTDIPQTATVDAEELAGRELAPGTSMYLMFVVLLLSFTGPAMFISSFFDHHVSPWEVASPLTLALVGAALVGILPALVAASRVLLWEDARVLVAPVVVIVWGLLLTTTIGTFVLDDAPRNAVYMLLWLVGITALALFAIPMLISQFREPRLDLAVLVPFPGWTKPLVAILGSAHFGLGVGLIGAPAFWSQRIPWDTNLLDARVLGVWCVGLGVGLLGALAEDDLMRLGAGMKAMFGIGVAELVALACNTGAVDWSSWEAASVLALAGGLIAVGLVGPALVTMSDQHRQIHRTA